MEDANSRAELEQILANNPASPRVQRQLREIAGILYATKHNGKIPDFIKELIGLAQKLRNYDSRGLAKIKEAYEKAATKGREIVLPKIRTFQHIHSPFAYFGYVNDRLVPTITGEES